MGVTVGDGGTQGKGTEELVGGEVETRTVREGREGNEEDESDVMSISPPLLFVL